MKTLRLYLWKEWRDHRAILLGIAIAVPLLLLLAAALLPSTTRENPLFTSVGAFGAFAMVALSLAGDLIPGESRRETLGFLRRLPADLGSAFAAKILFLGGALLLLTSWGFCAAGVIAVFPDALDRRILYIAPLAGWLFAVSSWLPRGALSLPAALLLLGALGVPLYLLYDQSTGFVPTQGELWLFALVMGLGALPVAWFSFVRGYRFGRGPLSAGWRGLLASLLLAAPLWGYVGREAGAWREIDATSTDCHLYGGVLAEGERYLYVNARMRPDESMRTRPVHPLRLDLETGEWRGIGGIGDSVSMFHNMRTVQHVHVKEAGSEAVDELHPGLGKSWIRVMDARTGEMEKSAWSNTLPPAERVDGLPERWRCVSRAGLGWSVTRGNEGGIFDPFRKRVYSLRDLKLRAWPLVRPGAWILHTAKGNHLFDPDSGEQRPVLGIEDRYRPALDPMGRVVTTDRARGEIVCIDPETGERTVIGSSRATVAIINAETGIFGVHASDDRFVLARLRDGLEEAEDVRFWNFQHVATLDDGSVVCILDYRRVMRVYFGGKPSRQLWPRPR